MRKFVHSGVTCSDPGCELDGGRELGHDCKLVMSAKCSQVCGVLLTNQVETMFTEVKGQFQNISKIQVRLRPQK